EIARCFPGFTILRLLFEFGRASEAGPPIFRSHETSVNLPQNKTAGRPACEIKKRNGKHPRSKAYLCTSHTRAPVVLLYDRGSVPSRSLFALPETNGLPRLR